MAVPSLAGVSATQSSYMIEGDGGIMRSPKGKGKMRDVAPELDAAEKPNHAQLPWVEKYRPTALHNVISHGSIISTLGKFVQEKRLPHLLFYGPPGSGKTTVANALANSIFPSSSAKGRSMVLELNASDERGIDVVREQIKTFAATRTLSGGGNVFGKARSDGQADGPQLKLVILDEADAMTSAAQNALRRVIEKYVRHVRFILICNYTSKIIPALQSRCTKFRFAPLPKAAMKERLNHVIACEQIKVTLEATEAILELAKGDMRRVLHIIQSAAAAFEVVDEDAIYACTAAAHPTDLDRLLHWLLNEDFATAFTYVRQMQTERALAVADILQAMFERVDRLQLPPNMQVYLTKQLAEIE